MRTAFSLQEFDTDLSLYEFLLFFLIKNIAKSSCIHPPQKKMEDIPCAQTKFQTDLFQKKVEFTPVQQAFFLGRFTQFLVKLFLRGISLLVPPIRQTVKGQFIRRIGILQWIGLKISELHQFNVQIIHCQPLQISSWYEWGNSNEVPVLDQVWFNGQLQMNTTETKLSLHKSPPRKWFLRHIVTQACRTPELRCGHSKE